MSVIVSVMTTKFECHIPINESGRKAIDWLAQACTAVASELSRAELKAVMQKGAVWLSRQGSTQRLRRASRLLNSGDELHLYYDPKVLDQPLLTPQLIADEGDYSVWNKPCGMLCQGSKYGDQTTLYRWAETQLLPERPAFIVHRLDRATRGLILLAHNKRSAQRLSALFEARQVVKHYRALVKGCLQLDDQLVDAQVDGKAARSRMTTLAVDAAHDRSLIEIKLETGRKHQIRVHLLGLGHPILGDRLYGSGLQDGCDLQLQSCYLALSDTQGGAVEYRLEDAELLNI